MCLRPFLYNLENSFISMKLKTNKYHQDIKLLKYCEAIFEMKAARFVKDHVKKNS